jgi:potassium-transporting ATPase potassium-binding subunit
MLQIIIFAALLLIIVKPFGIYIWKVFSGQPTALTRVVKPVENAIFRLCGIDSKYEMPWTTYVITMLFFNLSGVLVLYCLLRTQGYLPLNPTHAPGMPAALAFNTAASFVTNTNWQAYVGETAVSHLSQMMGLAWQNFASAATGLALAIAFVRGLTRQSVKEIGNFWVDLVRGLLYILVPISFIIALVYVSQGVVQNFAGPVIATTLEGIKQYLPQGPVASQEAIKIFGTNGGGFFNANSAHPFENPTPLTNLVQMLSMLSIPASLTYTFGRFAKNQRQGWTIFAAMAVLLTMSVSVMFYSEQAGNPMAAKAGVNQTATARQAGGNMEGKETRFGIADTSLYASLTTVTSDGAVIGMHDSFTPLAGGMAILNIALGEVVFGGVGVGLLGIFVFAILTVFIAGLMVGRTPEYLGKKIQAKEMKMVMLAILVINMSILIAAAIAVATKPGLAGILNPGPHGLSEILYATTSAAGNNGSALAGLTANSGFYNIMLGIIMLLGRFFFIIPTMAIAGSIATKTHVPESSGTFPTNGALFAGLLVGVILIVGALTFFPVFALGPIVEHLLMNAGRLF